MNKKGAGPVEGWIDYLLLFVIGLFGFIFLFTFLSFSLLFRDDTTIKMAESQTAAENLINEQKWTYASGDAVDFEVLKGRVNYINYLNRLKQQPEPEFETVKPGGGKL